MYLLDTGLLLDLRRGEAGGCAPGLVGWAGGVARQRMFLSVVSLIELERAAAAAERKARDLGLAWRQWIDEQILPAFDGQILPIDAAIARRQAELPLADTRDALLAASALAHNLTLATYRAAQFKHGKLKTFDPRGYEPDMESDWREAARTGSAWLKNLFVRA
ncbi:MAG: PIN domain-containing protein [Sphingobium sp.]|nr:PIN domain-containing protein [Sphingobium sp.]